MAVWFRRLADSVWVVQAIASYELINNTAVLQEAPSVALYDMIEIRVADTQDELTESPSEISIVAGLATEIAELASEPVRTYLATAGANATNAQLEAWNAEAEKMTANSYANEAEDVYVKSYSSNGDGTFSYVNTTEFSALHYAAKTNGDRVLNIVSFVDLQLVDPAYATKIELTELYTGVSESGGVFWYDATVDKSTADAIDIIDPSVSLALQGTGVGLGCWIRSTAIKHLLVADAITAFGMPVNIGTLIYQLDTRQAYRVITLRTATNTITDGGVEEHAGALADLVEKTSVQALHPTNAIYPSGNDIVLQKGDGSTETVDVTIHVPGVDQTWQDLIASRTHTTAYLNNTLKPINVAISITTTTAGREVQVSPDQVTWTTISFISTSGNASTHSFLVPVNIYYRINGAVTINSWSELR